MTGVPQPKLRWYHDGEEVVADYSKELAEDGSLTMPSAETKHSEVYQLVAVNKAGSSEREMKLFVKKEGEPSPIYGQETDQFLYNVQQKSSFMQNCGTTVYPPITKLSFYLPHL